MCGINGYLLSEPKDPELTHEFLTQLTIFTEERGKEATGFWAVEKAEPGRIISYKEPVPATEFVKRPIWKKLGELNPNICIVHCRQPSKFGDAKNNENNHPHLSHDACTALVHNGNIVEYTHLQNDYATTSSCDSEIILRIFENASLKDAKSLLKNKEIEDNELALKIAGIRDIFAKINHGAMAVAIGERLGTKRRLWLLRNDQRPLHIVNLMKPLGAYFFFSTPKILHQALAAVPKLKAMVPGDMEIMEITPNAFMTMETDETGKLNSLVYTIVKSSTKDWVKDDQTSSKVKLEKQKLAPPVEVLTDEIPKPPPTVYNAGYQGRSQSSSSTGTNFSHRQSNNVLDSHTQSADDDTIVLHDFDKKACYDEVCVLEEKMKQMLKGLEDLSQNKAPNESDYNSLISNIDEISSGIRKLEKTIAS